MLPSSTRIVPRISLGHTRGPIFFDEVDSAALMLPLGQPWLSAPEPAFRPGKLRLALAGGDLLVDGTLSDDHVTTTSTADQQLLWELGDVFELFIQAAGQPDYHEFQFSPRGHRLQLHYPHATADRTHGLGAFLRPTLIGEQTVRIEPDAKRWRIALRLPLALLIPAGAQISHTWSLAACRYDYHRDGTFTLSSTAPLAQPQFHRLSEWTQLHFPPVLIDTVIAGLVPRRPTTRP